MKKILFLLVTLCMFMVGCQSLPTPEKMTTTAKAVGFAAGMVANQTDIDNDSRNTVVDIVNKVTQCVPQTNETFKVAWSPIAKVHIQILVSEGKITEQQAVLIMDSFVLVVDGMDYVFDYRYPEARKYEDLINAAIHGFSDGFLTVFKPTDSTVRNVLKVQYDVDAYNYLKSRNK